MDYYGTLMAHYGNEDLPNFAFLQIQVFNIIIIHYYNAIMVMNPLLVCYFILLPNAFSITVCPALSYAVEKIESMLEAADVLKSSGKELLCLLPTDSQFMQTTNKIQKSLKSLSPCNGHVTEIPVSDFDVPEFGEPVFTQQQQQEQLLLQEQPAVPLPSTVCTKCTAPAAAAGSTEQQATDVVNVDDPENVDPDDPAKAPKSSKKSARPM